VIRYLTTLDLPDSWLDRLRAAVTGVEVRRMVAADAREIPDSIWREVDVLHTHAAIPELEAAPRLQWVQLDTAGIDHLTTHPIWASPIPVTTLAGVSGVPVAEYVMMMVLAHHHQLPALLDGQRRHEWPPMPERFERYRPAPTVGTTMVIVGFGRIGREVARLARAYGMHVIGVSRRRRGEEGSDVESYPVSELPSQLPLADVLVVAVPLTDATRGLLGEDMLAHLSPRTMLIDVGRGGIVDPVALQSALDDGRVTAATLDVFDPEPLPAGQPLWDDPRVIITPHVAGFSPAYHEEILTLVTDNLQRLRDGHTLRNLVDRDHGY
jgi:phosphoglycerate dehydrogenase-like enzyme